MAADFTGSIGNDTQAGTGGDELFDFSQGGQDSLDGGGGDDTFDMGAAFDADDTIDGGLGSNTIELVGDYLGLVLKDTSFMNVAELNLSGGDFEIALADGNVAFDHQLEIVVDGDSNIIDGSAITQGQLYFTINNVDAVYHLTGGANDDTFDVATKLARDMRFDGGDGYDTLLLSGGASSHLSGKMLSNIEAIVAMDGTTLVTQDANVLAGETLNVSMSASFGPAPPPTLQFSGHKETDGHFIVTGGEFDDQITGGHLDDTLRGGMGADILVGGEGRDRLHGGAGPDVYLYLGVRDSHKGAADLIVGLSNHDQIDLSLIDADVTQAGVQSFTLVGEFGGNAGELDVVYDGTVTRFLGDTDGDGKADLIIVAEGDHGDYENFILVN